MICEPSWAYDVMRCWYPLPLWQEALEWSRWLLGADLLGLVALIGWRD